MSVCSVLLIIPLSTEAWFAEYFLFEQIQWAPDSQSIVFKGVAYAAEGGGGHSIMLQCDLETQRVMNLTPQIDWYMISPSQKWLVFADYHGLYIAELHQLGGLNGPPVQVHFQPFFGYGSRWILVGFSSDESTFIYGKYDQYYEVPLPATLAGDVQSFPHNEISEDFSCERYQTFTRYYEARKGVTHRRGESLPITDKCESADSHVNTLSEKLATLNVTRIPDWVVNSQPEQPCQENLLMPIGFKSQKTSYTIQFATGNEDSAYVPLREYAEYLDSLGLRAQLKEYYDIQPQFRLSWGHFMTRSAAGAAQKCLQQQFQLSSQIIEQNHSVTQHSTSQGYDVPLTSFGRVISPDKSKTAYIKHAWYASYPEPITEIWIVDHGHQYEYSLVEALSN